MDELTELLVAARGGDRVALAAVIRRTQAEVWRLCRHLVDPAEADDVTQEVYLRAWRSLPTWRADSSARTWLLAIARRTCVDAVRKRQRGRRLQVLADPERSPRPRSGVRGVGGSGQRPEPLAPDPTGEIELTELLAGLDPAQRAAFTLTQVIGLSYAEAAKVCECPVGTIRSRVARARTALVAELAAAASR
jgi:RNA polymerase sigma-70 factor, ECF subfamily